MSGTCCPADAPPPVSVDYTPKGTTEQLKDMPVYITGAGPHAIVLAYDIFGAPYKQVYQVADKLAEGGFLVAVPDFFRGDCWPMAKFPPGPQDDFMGWVGKHAWADHVGADFRAAIGLLQLKGGERFGTVGFCWGGYVALEACGAGLVSAAAACHPAFFGKDKELAEKAQCPVALLPAKGDAMESLKEVLDHKPFADKCLYRRFDSQQHGFMAARGDFSNPETAREVSTAVSLLRQFFADTLKA